MISWTVDAAVLWLSTTCMQTFSALHVITMNVIGLLSTVMSKNKFDTYFYIIRQTAWCRFVPLKDMEPG